MQPATTIEQIHVMDNKTFISEIIEVDKGKYIIATNEKVLITYDKEKCNRHSHTIKIALSDSKIWDNNFKRRINEKTEQLMKLSGIRKTLEGKYIKIKNDDKHTLALEAPTENKTSATAPRERGSPEGLASGLRG